jgi:peptidoglycan-associated lipoprotein
LTQGERSILEGATKWPGKSVFGKRSVTVSQSLFAQWLWRKEEVGSMRPSKFFPVLVAGLLALGLAACEKNAPAAGFGLGSGAGNFVPGSAQEFSGRIGDTVRFETDSPELTPEARSILTAQAVWLRQYSNYPIALEGHADERGTREYNIALGARRAETVKNFLISQGVNPGRLRTISYGKERPVAICDNITCWSQNRRAVTVLGGGGAVASN